MSIINLKHFAKSETGSREQGWVTWHLSFSCACIVRYPLLSTLSCKGSPYSTLLVEEPITCSLGVSQIEEKTTIHYLAKEKEIRLSVIIAIIHPALHNSKSFALLCS